MDDFIICCNDTEWYDNFLIKLKQSFTLKDLGDLNQVLQIDIKMEPDFIEMSQKRQIENAAIQYGLLTEEKNMRPAATPMEANLDLQPAVGEDHTLPYRALLGTLLWIARNTRPDIFFSVIYLARFSNAYSSEHYRHLKRVLRYLVCTKDHKLTYTRQEGATNFSKFFS